MEPCPVCHGPAENIGTIGACAVFRCRDCGVVFTLMVTEIDGELQYCKPEGLEVRERHVYA